MAKKKNCTAKAKNTTAVERWNNEGCRGSTLLGHEFTPDLLSLTHTHRLYVCRSLSVSASIAGCKLNHTILSYKTTPYRRKKHQPEAAPTPHTSAGDGARLVTLRALSFSKMSFSTFATHSNDPDSPTPRSFDPSGIDLVSWSETCKIHHTVWTTIHGHSEKKKYAQQRPTGDVDVPRTTSEKKNAYCYSSWDAALGLGSCVENAGGLMCGLGAVA